MPLRWGTGYMLGSKRFGPFGRRRAAAFGHTGLTNMAVWADPERRLSVGVISSGKPGRHPEAGPLHRAAGPDHRRDTAHGRVNCGGRFAGLAFRPMGDSLLQQQLDEVRALLQRARELFGSNPVAPPDAERR